MFKHIFTLHKSINTYYLIIFSHYNNKIHGSNKSHMINGKNYYDQNYY
jgi:hypothetical protein